MQNSNIATGANNNSNSSNSSVTTTSSSNTTHDTSNEVVSDLVKEASKEALLNTDVDHVDHVGFMVPLTHALI